MVVYPNSTVFGLHHCVSTSQSNLSPDCPSMFASAAKLPFSREMPRNTEFATTSPHGCSPASDMTEAEMFCAGALPVRACKVGHSYVNAAVGMSWSVSKFVCSVCHALKQTLVFPLSSQGLAEHHPCLETCTWSEASADTSRHRSQSGTRRGAPLGCAPTTEPRSLTQRHQKQISPLGLKRRERRPIEGHSRACAKATPRSWIRGTLV